MRLSKSSPPRWVSPAVALTSNVPLSIVRIETSQAIGNGGSSGLIDDADDIEAGNGTGILGGLSLRVAKVGRDVLMPLSGGLEAYQIRTQQYYTGGYGGPVEWVSLGKGAVKSKPLD
ncbi:NAD-specific glutamate dehydrogenase [Striga asiatica]|uniref:NAD-specific glutamate dehydrogenase n=1 Tax=Striga asiatica TaxID=4170 RepID=A0A5A7R308_STRAF|nr:NAD-specific glutamate dehydrogenase [Striga asiatica]